MPFFLALALTWASMPLVMELAEKMGAVAQPGGRHIHARPIPRLGGLGIALGLFIGWPLAVGLDSRLAGLILSSLWLVLLGIIDDWRGMKAWHKLLGQLAAALILVGYGFYSQWAVNPFGGLFYIDGLGAVFSILWVVGLINTINLTDGLDGLAGGITLFASLFLALLFAGAGEWRAARLALVLAGAVLGFLFYNFHPARIFLGDTGSMLLGFTLAAITLEGMAGALSLVRILVPVLILALPISDVLLAIIRRRANGQGVFVPDRGHLHHRLLDWGLSQRQAVLVLYGGTCSLGLLAIGLSGINLYYSFTALLAGGIILRWLYGQRREVA
ncbi:UDP-GlcNAc:undecaprenyl-phosphate GlcNAc-1-phosphate transferase [Carboxydocella sporoproducens DSM 16521]|uniref:UDP-GlcNAc:undecaprenyl-phosphate GlcNAc-1-phosphate transferase n=2 Tax=Carboxydocella TaxID=178898 RepID=A0A1T4LCP0_9FIRM|nr:MULTISPECIES: MraY family glycosyltransferase [Carboxydocella]AVX19847.1 UDP-GlcNAc:undecaprenyl-phosphate GlcNAc-1-phosphate transferase [Carboxydocella thermautotrophica]SJZ52416.1 UDP-GlcNAc:undecaprenyl-phosphate GlcNAc-1-phosphate transferase [Carboxydocella sporoproducens DSM 16521]